MGGGRNGTQKALKAAGQALGAEAKLVWGVGGGDNHITPFKSGMLQERL